MGHDSDSVAVCDVPVAATAQHCHCMHGSSDRRTCPKIGGAFAESLSNIHLSLLLHDGSGVFLFSGQLQQFEHSGCVGWNGGFEQLPACGLWATTVLGHVQCCYLLDAVCRQVRLLHFQQQQSADGCAGRPQQHSATDEGLAFSCLHSAGDRDAPSPLRVDSLFTEALVRGHTDGLCRCLLRHVYAYRAHFENP